MNINIETDYNIGDKLYIIDAVPVFEECDTCDAKGYLDLKKGGQVECPDCKGECGRCTESLKYIPIASEISTIKVIVTRDATPFVRYSLEFAKGVRHTIISELDKMSGDRGVFSTKEKAQEFCDTHTPPNMKAPF